MDSPHIARIEQGILEGVRPRKAGSNARLGEHGVTVRVPIVRVTADDGSTGFGYSRATQELATSLLGVTLHEVFDAWRGPDERAHPVEYPLWDLACNRAGMPAYLSAAQFCGRPAPAIPFSAPCYDTSLYFDDLHLTDTEEAAALLAAEARAGYERGHRAFKIKVGRGGRHMELEAGMRRDVAVTRAVRAAVGPGLPLMVDANNGYNLNLTKRFLTETADCALYWIEEPFHEDAVLYKDLREWMVQQGLRVMIADGEGDASPRLMDMARDHLIDVVQRDVISTGFIRLMIMTKQLEEWGALLAPHHYGTAYGNYVSCHLAAASPRFAFAEWDEAVTPGLYAPGYAINEGRVSVPPLPGFGLDLDEDVFAQAVLHGGFSVSA
jgi:L-alanine-DL-glutamate epimerase-like enolase superfamily enzyme